jgi:hypothetical protein
MDFWETKAASDVLQIERALHPSRRSRTCGLADSPDLASNPCVRGIGIDSRMPDHQVLEAGYLCRRLQHLDFAIFCLQSCKSPGYGKSQFGSRNAPGSGPEIWQRNHGSTAMTVRC